MWCCPLSRTFMRGKRKKKKVAIGKWTEQMKSKQMWLAKRHTKKNMCRRRNIHLPGVVYETYLTCFSFIFLFSSSQFFLIQHSLFLSIFIIFFSLASGTRIIQYVSFWMCIVLNPFFFMEKNGLFVLDNFIYSVECIWFYREISN